MGSKPGPHPIKNSSVYFYATLEKRVREAKNGHVSDLIGRKFTLQRVLAILNSN